MKKETRKYTDRAIYLKQAVQKRRNHLREKAIQYKGGQCMFCAYNRCKKALEFHHIRNKKFGISARGITRAWNKIQKELDKCILVCANCHRELHAGLLQPPSEMME